MKLAIVIIGMQNSGKTSTIKELINTHSDKTVSKMRKGWQRIYLNNQFKYLKLDIFCVPSSPTESNIKLSERFENWQPEVLIVAEQLNGRHYNDTLNFLNLNGYIILTYRIANIDGPLDWERYTDIDKDTKLNNRVNQIVAEINQFLTNNNLI